MTKYILNENTFIRSIGKKNKSVYQINRLQFIVYTRKRLKLRVMIIDNKWKVLLFHFINSYNFIKLY